MITEPIDVLLVGLTDHEAAALEYDDGFTATRAGSLDEAPSAPAAGAVVLALEGDGPLDALRRARDVAPDAAIVVVSDDAHAADGTVALHAGAEDQLPRDATLPTLLPRAVRYAVVMRRVRRELATKDEATELPNLRGFAAIAEHHVRMADRLNEPVVFVFVRLDDHDRILREEGADAADTLARHPSAGIPGGGGGSDPPARISRDTICILLPGAADGAESLVLSRLVEAIATHDARSATPRALSLGVGTARYEAGSGTTLAEILSGAVRGLTGNRTG